MQNDIEYKGRFIRTQADGVWILNKDGDYITACVTVNECKELIDELITPDNADQDETFDDSMNVLMALANIK